MSPRAAPLPPLPAAASLRDRTALTVGMTLREERQRRGWTLTELSRRARLSIATVSGVEAGRVSSLESYARLATALGLSLDVTLLNPRRRSTRELTDVVHAAMGDIEAGWLTAYDYEVALDHPYQHYQFAGRADVVAWTLQPTALLHIENRTRFIDLQQAAGSYNAKRQYLAPTMAKQLGIGEFASETHVMAALWSAEVLHSVRMRRSSFQVLCPDPSDRLEAWLAGTPPSRGTSSTFVVMDPTAAGRQARTSTLDRVLGGVRPRVRGYAEAARLLPRV